MPLLPDLLRLAAENRRLGAAPILEDLEDQVDQLHHAVQQQQKSEEDRLRTQKLNALAEFAAGAGHEINNPLAVISGQAQYLLHHEVEPGRQAALQTIVSQARRIHQILSEVMQFARPSKPRKELVDLPRLLQELTDSLGEFARQRQVQLIYSPPEQPLDFRADRAQVATALACLLRNALEAAPPDGWARVRVETLVPDRLDLVVEDSGEGPGPAQREHLFDPFYSGRQAGRGRGLGLATAWRLARQHDGDLRFDDFGSGPTRFVLSFPLEPESRNRESGIGNQESGTANGDGHPEKNGCQVGAAEERPQPDTRNADTLAGP